MARRSHQFLPHLMHDCTRVTVGAAKTQKHLHQRPLLRVPRAARDRQVAPSGDGTWSGQSVPCSAPVRRANVLVTGPDEAIARFLDAVLPALRQPVSRWVPGQCLLLPAVEELGTLVIENAGALPPDAQRRLFDWLTLTLGRTQIVSTTATSLLTLVGTGCSLRRSTNRLNIICIDLAAPSPDLDAEWALSIAFEGL